MRLQHIFIKVKRHYGPTIQFYNIRKLKANVDIPVKLSQLYTRNQREKYIQYTFTMLYLKCRAEN